MAPPDPESGPPAPLILGILGGIASGKSTVARLLAGPEGWVLAADKLAHEVLDTPEVTELVRAHFGDTVLDAEGKVDRARLAARVFDPAQGAEARELLEGWTHPRVRARILERLREARAAQVPRVVLDIPLLLENDAQHGWTRLCDALVFVDVPLDERERRAQRTRGWTSGEVGRRESFQLPLSQKQRRADYVLPNHESLQELERRVAGLLEKLTSKLAP